MGGALVVVMVAVGTAAAPAAARPGRKRETHQRLMLIAVTSVLLTPGLGRWPSWVNPSLILPGLLAVVLAGPTRDLITRRSVHIAWSPFRHFGFCSGKTAPLHDFLA